MNYPRSLNKKWYKENNDLAFQNKKPAKDQNSVFQSEMKMQLPLLQGQSNNFIFKPQNQGKTGQYHELKKGSDYTLTTADADYRKKLMESTHLGLEHLANIVPISEQITHQKVVDYEKLFLDLVWKIAEVKQVELE